jgi:diaminopimelate epimerase
LQAGCHAVRTATRTNFPVVRHQEMKYPWVMEINFQKMHGTLNDFVVFHDLEDEIRLSPGQVRTICNRREGVGADGVIAVRKSSEADFFMDYVNADGSLAEMCGNGIRCVAKYAYDNGLTDRHILSVETGAGIKTLELFPDDDGRIGMVRVDMGEPVFEPKGIPVYLKTTRGPILDHPIEAEGQTFPASIVSMGNPHCVIVRDDDIEELPARYGPALENHPLFPAKTNVEFIRIVNRQRVIMRVWERGSGETFACGTGACAAAVTANLKGLVDGNCTVELRGGDLEISWQGINYPVLMTGPAVLTFKGVLSL